MILFRQETRTFTFSYVDSLSYPNKKNLLSQTGVSLDRLVPVAQMLALIYFAVSDPHGLEAIHSETDKAARQVFALQQLQKQLVSFKILSTTAAHAAISYIHTHQKPDGSQSEGSGIVSEHGLSPTAIATYIKKVPDKLSKNA